MTITLNKMKTHVKKRVIQIHPSFPLFYLKSFRHICSSDFIVFVGQHSFFKLTRFKHLQKKTSTFFSSLSFLKNWVLLTELLMQIYHCKGFLKLTFWTLAMHQSADKCWKPQDLRRTKEKKKKKRLISDDNFPLRCPNIIYYYQQQTLWGQLFQHSKTAQSNGLKPCTSVFPNTT